MQLFVKTFTGKQLLLRSSLWTWSTTSKRRSKTKRTLYPTSSITFSLVSSSRTAILCQITTSRRGIPFMLFSILILVCKSSLRCWVIEYNQHCQDEDPGQRKHPSWSQHLIFAGKQQNGCMMSDYDIQKYIQNKERNCLKWLVWDYTIYYKDIISRWQVSRCHNHCYGWICTIIYYQNIVSR